MYDCIIVGKGPAGLSAALYLGRDGYKVLVVGLGSMLEKAEVVENYLGIFAISGTELLQISKKQVTNVGVEIKEEKVLNIYNKNEEFNVVTNIGEYKSKCIILALGSKKGNAKIKNAEKFVGKGISYCVSCDGFFYKDKNVGVIGSSEHAVEEAIKLKNYTDNVTIYTNGKDMKVTDKYIDYLKNFNVDNRKIEHLDGEDELSHIVFSEDDKIKIDGVFIANDTPNIDDLSNNLGILTEKNKVVIDENNMTNVKAVFACGDMINDFKQVSTAVGSGAAAGNSCIKYLINSNLSEKVKKL
ncbi:MAG: FAD-dependent oxidoreductase [Clostridia bacterium]|nr:FAD-dependent oxidoreductase [Clostridia bacterium]